VSRAKRQQEGSPAVGVEVLERTELEGYRDGRGAGIDDELEVGLHHPGSGWGSSALAASSGLWHSYCGDEALAASSGLRHRNCGDEALAASSGLRHRYCDDESNEYDRHYN
jgi:hypothetical protein